MMFINLSSTWNHLATGEKVSWHGIWFGHATPKFRFCTWLAICNRLTTGDSITSIDGNCVFCNQYLETRNHFFFECSYVSLLWHKLISEIMGNNYTEEWNAILVFMSQLKLSGVKTSYFVMFFSRQCIWFGEKEIQENMEDNPRPLENLFRTINKLIKYRVMFLKTQDRRLDRAFQV